MKKKINFNILSNNKPIFWTMGLIAHLNNNSHDLMQSRREQREGLPYDVETIIYMLKNY